MPTGLNPAGCDEHGRGRDRGEEMDGEAGQLMGDIGWKEEPGTAKRSLS